MALTSPGRYIIDLIVCWCVFPLPFPAQSVNSARAFVLLAVGLPEPSPEPVTWQVTDKL